MPSSPLDRARSLILAHGWNSTCYQLLNPGFTLWFSAAGDAVVGYVAHHRTWIAGGAPVCAAERLGAVAAEFEAAARRAGRRVCYFGAEARLEALYRGAPGHAMVLMGSQPVWDPHGWAARVERHASLRAQLHRARNKGVRVAEWAPEAARDHPALRRCLAEWLETRGLPPLHFLVEPDTLARLFDRRCFVAEREGEVVGFVVASPVPQRGGWLVEQIVRGRHAVNGTAELMLDAAVRALAASGSTYVTLGLAPLSRQASHPADRSPAWLRLLLTWMRAYGRRFYNFRGLEAFKAKFDPERWDAIFAIVNEPRVGPAPLYAIAAAFAAGSPLTLLARAVGHATAQEGSRLAARLRRRTPGAPIA